MNKDKFADAALSLFQQERTLDPGGDRAKQIAAAMETAVLLQYGWLKAAEEHQQFFRILSNLSQRMPHCADRQLIEKFMGQQGYA